MFTTTRSTTPAFTFDPVSTNDSQTRVHVFPMALAISRTVSLPRTNFTAIPDRLRINAAIRYSVASYESRAANAELGPGGVATVSER